MIERAPNSLIDMRIELLGSYLLFLKVFYKLLTGREFSVSAPISREPREITIAKVLTKVLYLEINRLLINMPPGYGKSTMVSFFIAWAMAHYPDSQFLYVSHGADQATKNTYIIKQIMSLPAYKELFGIEIKKDSSAKDNFRTTEGGAVKAYGSGGPIVGMDAGLPFLNRFSGAIIIDDIHKPDDVHSDTRRDNVKRNYKETLLQRPRGPNVPIIFIGQRLHEDDVPGNLLGGFDGYNWHTVILKAIDEVGNVLEPRKDSKEKLEIEERVNPYVFASQYQQNPQPAGGALFKRNDFVLLEFEPEILGTCIVADTAETDKTWNDKTVFSFFGVYKIMDGEIETGALGMHCLDCVELSIEPKDLEENFNQFYYQCMRHPVKPLMAAIEKKSTGVTLVSVLRSKKGLAICDIERNCNSSKTSRLVNIQPFIAAKCISLPVHGKHTKMVLDHMEKITANDTHRFDDIADTFADGIKLCLIDKSVYFDKSMRNTDNKFREAIEARERKYDQLREQLWQRPMM